MTIDDNIFTYNSRSTTFINFLSRIPFRADKHLVNWESEGEIGDSPDILYMFGFQVSQEGKSYIRTRRKFVDDVATRGGQYSSIVIVLTALYYLL